MASLLHKYLGENLLFSSATKDLCLQVYDFPFIQTATPTGFSSWTSWQLIYTLYSSGSAVNSAWPGQKKNLTPVSCVVSGKCLQSRTQIDHFVYIIPPSCNLPVFWGSNFAFKTCGFVGDVRKYRHCFSLLVLFNPFAFHESNWRTKPWH